MKSNIIDDVNIKYLMLKLNKLDINSLLKINNE
jgi:hypothetical protein